MQPGSPPPLGVPLLQSTLIYKRYQQKLVQMYYQNMKAQ